MSHPGINVAVLVGALSCPPVSRRLPSGDHLVRLEVTVRGADGPAESVPVAWFGAPGAALEWPTGHPVVVVGRTRRRFFRSGGTTASRTEVVADTVVPARRRAGVRRALERCIATLDAVGQDG